MCPLPPFEWYPQFSVKRKITYWASFSHILYLLFSSFKFLNVFLPAETVILGYSWVAFWPVITCKMMHQIAYGFYLSIKCSKLSQKSLGHFASFFIYAHLHLWVTPQNFAKWGLIKIYICGKFHHYSICDCEVEDFWIDSAFMKWPLFRIFWALNFPNIV